MQAPYVFINNSLLPVAEAKIAVSDLALQRGYGIFDFFKTLNHQPVFLEEHLDRFFHSAQNMRLPVGLDRDGLKAAIAGLMEHNQMKDSGIKIVLTGGDSEDGYSISSPNLIMTQQALTMPTEAIFQKGLKLMSYAHQRQMPEIKTIDYLMAVWLQPIIKERGADDVLYHDNGLVSECPRSNFFIVTKEDKVVTPGRNTLKGVIRMKTLEIARGLYEVEERELTVEEAQQAKEAFITSTTKHILPVLALDGHMLSGGVPGKLTTALSRALNARVIPA